MPPLLHCNRQTGNPEGVWAFGLGVGDVWGLEFSIWGLGMFGVSR